MNAELFDEVEAVIRRYCVLPHEHAYVALTLWCATTHVLPAFDYAPRCVARSPEKRSGKSRVGEVAAGLSHDPLRTVNATTSYIFRSLDKPQPPTIFLDEADTIFGTRTKAEQNEDLRGLLNAGHQRGLPFGRTVGPMHTPTEFEAFAMAFVAGIGRMPDTIEDRAIILRMRRRKPSEVVAPFRVRRDGKVLDDLRDQLAAWSTGALPALDGAEPTIPAGVEDRAADTWEPLLAVAEYAGGEWTARAREACKFMVHETEEDSTEVNVGSQLLSDVRRVFKDTTMPSQALCDALNKLSDAPWGEYGTRADGSTGLTPTSLGRRLNPYGLKPRHNADKSARVYHRADFADTWDRYLPKKVSEDVPSRPNGSDQQECPDTLDSPDTLKVSGPSKVSGQKPRSEGMEHPGTPSDTLGARCRCGAPIGELRAVMFKDCVTCHDRAHGIERSA